MACSRAMPPAPMIPTLIGATETSDFLVERTTDQKRQTGLPREGGRDGRAGTVPNRHPPRNRRFGAHAGVGTVEDKIAPSRPQISSLLALLSILPAARSNRRFLELISARFTDTRKSTRIS